MGSRLTLFCAVWLLLGAGCSTLNSRNNIFESPSDNSIHQSFQKKNVPDQAKLNQANLHAALDLLDQNKPDDAKLYADKVDLFSLSTYEQVKLNLAFAQIHLSHAEAEPALNRLASIKYSLLAPTDKIAYLRSRAFASSLAGKLIDSAKARITLQTLLKDSHEQHDNKLATLDVLRLLPEATLAAKQQSGQSTLGAWMALANIIKNNPTISINDPNLTTWRNNFPKHPANGAFLTSFLATTQEKPKIIALMLPGSGPYAEAAKAIKAGFMAAYAEDDQKPQILFFDTSTSDPVSLYKQAVEQGVQLIIGPLNKEHVQDLAQNANLDIPVLTLNHLPGINKVNLYQFALSPIDDAEEVTRRAEQDGFKKVLLLTPNSELGERMQAYFKTALKNSDGKLVKSKSYDPKAKDYSSLLKNLLNSGETEKRVAQVSKAIPDLHYSPRARQDIEAIFITAYPQNAHSILSELKVLGFGDIPVYATSHIYNGVVNPADIDLDGITFCDIPWLFNMTYPGNLSQEALRGTWQKFPEIYLRLIAMGIDAYNLVPNLSKLDNKGQKGASGHLLLTDDNRIQRQLVCAKFNHNQPRLIGYLKNKDSNVSTLAPTNYLSFNRTGDQ